MQDILEVTFLNLTNFTSSDSGIYLNPESRVVQIKIKPQMPDTSTTRSFISSSGTADTIMKLTFIFALILNFVLASKETIDYYVAMIQTLTIIVHFPLLKVVIPGNLSFFLSMLQPLVMFDLLNSVEDTPYDPSRMFLFAEELN